MRWNRQDQVDLVNASCRVVLVSIGPDIADFEEILEVFPVRPDGAQICNVKRWSANCATSWHNVFKGHQSRYSQVSRG